MTTSVVTASAPNRCSANSSGRTVTAWGMKSLPCQTRVGLRSFMDRAGTRRYYCAARDHEANARRRFGMYVSEIADDGLGQAKAAVR